MNRTYLYHRVHGARLFTSPEALIEAQAAGEWADTPADFTRLTQS